MHGYILVAKDTKILEFYKAKNEPSPSLFRPTSFFLPFPELNI